MEHIVQFAVGIDDDAIKKYVQDTASRKIIQEIKEDVLNKLFEPRYYNIKVDPKQDAFTNFTIEIFRSIVDEYKDEIINRAVFELANRMSRTKRVRSILEKMEEELVKE